MKRIKTIGYKDKYTRYSFLIGGLFFMILLNLLIFLPFMGYQFDIILYIFLILYGAVFYWKLRFLKYMKYEFSNKGISIFLPGNKSYDLPKSKIKSISKYPNKSIFFPIGIKIDLLKSHIYYITGRRNLYQIEMDDGKLIIISPKIITEKTIVFFNS